MNMHLDLNLERRKSELRLYACYCCVYTLLYYRGYSNSDLSPTPAKGTFCNSICRSIQSKIM